MIETVTMARIDVRRAAGPVRGRHPADRRGGRARRGGGLPDRRSACEAIQWHEKELTAYALDALRHGARACGSSARPMPVGRGGTISFALDGVHPHDVGQVLDSLGVQVRVGPPLRQAGLRPVRRAGDDPGVVLPLHHHRGDRRAGARSGAGAEGVRLMQLDQLYQEIILDHYKQPARPWPARAVRRREAHHVNPTCGDEVDRAGAPPTATCSHDISYDGMGCSISQASASVLHELLRGRSVGRRARECTRRSSS